MKVGTICKLKVDCLGNKAGTLGVVFYDYGDGFQAIFENGNLDGFSTTRGMKIGKAPFIERETEQVEADYFLEEVGFKESLASYCFKNVVQVEYDYSDGLFNIAWSKQGTTADILRKHKFGTEKLAEYLGQNHPKESEYEKCEVYADGNRPALLRFKRKVHTGEKQTPSIQSRYLSVAQDYEDFAYFEYADIGPSMFPRWIHGDVTIYPKFVVFRKK